MPFQVTPNGAKVVMPFTWFGQRFSVTLWFQMIGFNEANMLALADAVQASFYATLDTRLIEEVSYGPAQVYDMREEGGAVVTGSDDPEGGENAGDALPLKNACVLTLRTNKRGRSYRGRIFLAGFSETDCTNGLWSSTLTTAVENLGVAIDENTSASDWTWCVHSSISDKTLRPTGVLTPVTSWAVRSAIPGIQRRRNRRP